MSKFNRNQPPYYDDYDSTKGYTHLLANPGRVAQAREITQIQSVIKDIIKNIGDSILKDGDVVEGCQVSIKDNKVYMTEGKVYINGMVLHVAAVNPDNPDETPITIKGVGREIIGFILDEELVTEINDRTLLDPAVGYDNHQEPGCYRVKSTVRVISDDLNNPQYSDAAILVTLIDGVIAVERYAGSYSNMNQTLARRTNDESGSYIVDGLKVRVEVNPTDDSKFNAVIEAGKAYVLGHELRIPAPRRVPINKTLESEEIPTFNITYEVGDDTYLISNAPYVDSIIGVKGPREENLPINSSDTIYDISRNHNVSTIMKDTIKVYDSSSTPITGYSIKQGNEIGSVGYDSNKYYLVWDSTAPSNYSVSYLYIFEFPSSMWTKVGEGSHSIKFTEEAMSYMIDGETYSVSYNQYLARKDIIYIDKEGVIDVAYGIPAQYGYEILPDIPVDTIALAHIMIPPNGTISEDIETKITVSNVGLTRFTMNDIQNLLTRVRTIEYDQAILALNDEARQRGSTSSMKGIFVDPLIDYSRLVHDYINENIKFNCTIDFASNTCYLPLDTTTLDLAYRYEESSNYKKYSRTATMRSTGERILLSQDKATKEFPINPYSAFPELPEISLTPAVDTWIEDTIIEIPVSQLSNEVVRSSTSHIEINDTRGARRASTSTSRYTDTAIGTKVETLTSDSIIEESAIQYIRSRIIEVRGSYFEKTTVSCEFDGNPVNWIDDEGNEYRYIETADDGSFTARFKIPERTPVGIRHVVVRAGTGSEAFALYQASGTQRTIQRTVTTLTTVLLNRVTTITTTNYIDPVGQTFVLDRMSLISGVNLYFAEKAGDNGAPVTCEIREVVDGSITSTVYGHKTLPPSSVNIPTDSDNMPATRFNFEDPVLLESNKEYAIVIRSTSDRYKIWIAELGGTDVESGKTVLSNPYLIGLMMSSSNNSSWTMHQISDIKFDLIEEVYDTSSKSELYLEDLNLTDREFSRLYLLADAVTPSGTNITWMYSTNGVDYYQMNPYNINLFNEMHSSLSIKAEMSTNNPYLSPVIALDSIGVVLSNYEEEGYYVSELVRDIDPYSNVEVIIDEYIPENTNLSVLLEYTTSGEHKLEYLSPGDTARDLGYGWRERVYSIRDLTESDITECRIIIEMKSNNKYNTPAFRKLRVIIS